MPLVDESQTYNADAKIKARTSRTVIIADRHLHPVKITSEVMKEIITNSPEPLSDEEQEKLTPEQRRAETFKNLDDIIEQLSALLVDDQGSHPPVKFLTAALDIEEAGNILDWIMPNRKDAVPNPR